MRRILEARIPWRLAVLLALCSALPLASCWFFPTQTKFYQEKYLLGSFSFFDYTDVVVGSDGFVYFAAGGGIRRWSPAGGLEDYESFAGTAIEAMEIDEAGSTIYVLEGGNLWELDLSNGAKTQISVSLSSSASAIGIAGDYLVVRSLDDPTRYSLIRRSDHTVTHTIPMDVYARGYFFWGEASRLFIYSNEGGWPDDGIGMDVVDVDQQTGQFGTPTYYDVGSWPFSFWDLPVALLPGGNQILADNGCILGLGASQLGEPKLSVDGWLSGDQDYKTINAACVLGESLVTLDSTRSSLVIAVHSTIAPYEETKPAIQLDGEGRELLPRGDSLFLINRSHDGDTGEIQIYEFDTAIFQ